LLDHLSALCLLSSIILEQRTGAPAIGYWLNRNISHFLSKHQSIGDCHGQQCMGEITRSSHIEDDRKNACTNQSW
jgi:hypothetical protein